MTHAKDPLHRVMLFNARSGRTSSPWNLERQPPVVDAQTVQDRRVQVVNVNWIFHHIVAEVVSLAVDNPRLDAGARHPEREALGMVVAAVVVAGELALAIDGPAELAAPDHQRVVEQPALLEVGDQREGWPGRRLDTGRGRSPAMLPCWSQPR